MLFKEIRTAYEAASTKLSIIVRTFTIASLLVIMGCGILAPEAIEPYGILIRLLLIVLGLDMAHYASQTAIWYYFYCEGQKIPLAPDNNFSVPEWVNIPIWSFFSAKIIAFAFAVMEWAYVIL